MIFFPMVIVDLISENGCIEYCTAHVMLLQRYGLVIRTAQQLEIIRHMLPKKQKMYIGRIVYV